MKNLKPLLRRAGLVLGAAGALLALGFVERSTGHAPITELKVSVRGGEGIHFIDEKGVRHAIVETSLPVLGAPAREVDLAGIEQRLKAIPCVADAEVYHDLAGTLHVKVRQREPVLRVINADGSTFYIDADGWTMPMSEAYTARVPVATGWLQEPGIAGGMIHVHGDDSLMRLHRSDELHRLALFLRADPLWSCLIDQVVVAADGQFELVPTIGGQRILLGHGDALEQRFAKLKLFYQHGIPKSDWRRYARIDLRFNDQIVCTKRTNPNDL
jgi:cell division protein FtsQ